MVCTSADMFRDLLRALLNCQELGLDLRDMVIKYTPVGTRNERVFHMDPWSTPWADIKGTLYDPMLLLLEGILNSCGRHQDTWDLCLPCHASLNRDIIPQSSAKNLVNVPLCQDYPSALEDLTLTEEYLIAKCHPFATLQARSTGRTSRADTRGHGYKLTQLEHDSLAEWVLSMDSCGAALRPSTV
jgi:hypothetical protein